MKRIVSIILLITAIALSVTAQTIREQYATKAAACSDGTYRNSDGYREYGQIGWEKAVGWRPIKYLERYEKEHRIYPTNMFIFAQVMKGKDILDDCEIVAWDSEGHVVGNQCPEPSPEGDVSLTNMAIMSVFGSTGEVIHFTVLTGDKQSSLQEHTVSTTITFKNQAYLGYVDTDGDGREDAIQPVILRIESSVKGDVDQDGDVDLDDVEALRAILLGSSTASVPATADVDESGSVDIVDMTKLIDLLK